MESSFRLFRFRGIDVGANWSWLLVFALLVFQLWQSFPRTYPEVSSSAAFAMAVVAIVVFFISLLLHELGHAVQALKEGMEIDGITLWFFGGVARFKGMFPSAGAEFRIAIAGPVVTAVLVGVFAGITAGLNALDVPGHVVGVSDYLARINGILLAFNLVPALPLDGGRVLRSYLWYRQQSFTAATVSAARAGRAFGGVLIGIGLLGLFTGVGQGGLFIAFLGWFLLQAARAEVSFAEFRQAVGGMRVRNLMTPDPETVGPRRSIKAFITNVAHARGHSTYPVVERGRLVGLVSLRLAARVPEADRTTKTVGSVMLPAGDVPTVGPDDDVTDAVAKLQEGLGRAIVLDGGRVAGILSRSDIARAIEIGRIRGPADAEVPARRTPLVVWVVIIAMIAVVAGYLYTPPFAVVAPGQSFDVAPDISITGTANGKVNGRYLLTSVSVSQPNGLGLAYAILRSRQLVSLEALVPRGTDTDRFFREQRTLFTETQQVAAAAAARAAGLRVDLKGTGARITGVLPGSPASDAGLREGDVITTIDGNPVRLAENVSRVIRSRPSGTQFALNVEREGRSRQAEVRSREGIVEGQPGIGVVVDTRDFDIALPFEVKFAAREIGGPSAGITYALAVYDMLVDRDIADGRSIASTGEINLEGRVGPVGGVKDKGIAAERAGADLFLVPEEEVEEARGSGLTVRGIATLMEAIEFLSSRSA
ncbi:MAG TPA: CBS domain-containing protein [Actinomycetota bacterium]|jgi:PDZ domain-containing secreted protein/Zn-dependent protease/CBS domain-containing protein|nr:CBS domain-containing protein [Actinomycetota bacterium]